MFGLAPISADDGHACIEYALADDKHFIFRDIHGIPESDIGIGIGIQMKNHSRPSWLIGSSRSKVAPRGFLVILKIAISVHSVINFLQ